MDSQFYQEITQAEYNALLKEGQSIYVPDREFMEFLWPDDPDKFPGVPAIARMIETTDGVTIWQLTPMAETIAAHFIYGIKPVADGVPIVVRTPKDGGNWQVCLVSELYTLEQEVEFKLLMSQAGIGDSGEGEEKNG